MAIKALRTNVLVIVGGVWGILSLSSIRTSLYRADGSINWGSAILMLPGTVTQLVLSPLARIPSVYFALAITLSVLLGFFIALGVDIGLDHLFHRKPAK